MLKKSERKENLTEVFMLIREIDSPKAKQAKEIVLNMLGHDGVYILDVKEQPVSFIKF